MQKLLYSLSVIAFMSLLAVETIAIKDPSLVLYFSFDEGVGDKATDKSGNNHVGALKNGVKWTKDGKQGGALQFDGIDDQVEVPVSPKLDIKKEITLEAWIFPDSAPGDSNLFGRRTAGNTGGYTMQWTAGKVETWIWVATWTGTRGVQKIVPKVKDWHHVAGVYNGSSIKQYVNGDLDIEVPLKGDINSVAEVFRIGQAQTSLAPMPGIIDEVAVYNRALSEKEIKQDIKDGVLPLSVDGIGKLAVTWGSLKRAK